LQLEQENIKDHRPGAGGVLRAHLLVLLLSGIAVSSGLAQQPKTPLPAGDPRTWAEAATNAELSIIQSEGSFPLRYRVRKVDAKGDTTREVIETRQGTVARLVERDGQPLTAEQDAAERERLNDQIASPDDFLRHHKRDRSTEDYSMQLVRLLPQAMLYSYAPGQPQPAGETSPQVVLDFRPNPAFKPTTMLAEVLTGIEGRVWIDARSHVMTRIEGRILHPVNFGFGILAKLYPGGTLEFEQMRVSGDRWAYRHLEEHVTVREMMVKTAVQNVQITSWDMRIMPELLDYQDAIRLLLAMNLPLK
jgi:hypothetical protein